MGAVMMNTVKKIIRKIITERDLTAMRNRNTLLRAEQSRAEHGLTAPFLRLAIAGRLKPHIAFVMDNRRILTGLLCPVRYGENIKKDGVKETFLLNAGCQIRNVKKSHITN